MAIEALFLEIYEPDSFFVKKCVFALPLQVPGSQPSSTFSFALLDLEAPLS